MKQAKILFQDDKAEVVKELMAVPPATYLAVRKRLDAFMKTGQVEIRLKAGAALEELYAFAGGAGLFNTHVVGGLKKTARLRHPCRCIEHGHAGKKRMPQAS